MYVFFQAVVMMFTCSFAPPKPTPTFKIDRPFHYQIRDESLALFMGSARNI